MAPGADGEPADLARNMAEAEKIAQQNAEREEAANAAPTTARQMYDAYINEGLTPEEVSQGVQNDFKAAKDAYDAKVTEKPTIKARESTASFIERKKAYNEELGRLEQELRMQQALMDEIAKIQTPATEETAVEEAPVAEEVLEDNGIGVEAIGLDESAAEGEDVRFSTIREVNDRFNAELQQQIDGTLPVGHVYQLGMPSRILRSTGIPGLPITLQSSILNIKSNDALHSYDLSEVKDLVKAIQKPWAIFKYGDSQKAQNLIVGIAKGDKQFLIGISLNPTVKGKTLNINSVRNVFPKDNDEWLNWIQEGKLLRVDEKEKIQAIIDALRINPVDYTHLDLDSIANIVENFENPSSEDARFSVITPQMDADYLAAVERGDMETAQRMVLEAAKLAMPNTKVVDENGNPKVVYHQTNAKVYVNRETGQNWDELNWKEKMEWDERDDWEDYWEERDFNTFSRVNARTTNEFDGFFFAPKYDEYHEYGDRTIAAFVNIQNPASREDYNIDSRYSDAGREERVRLQEAGFDGVIRMDGEEVDEYIAFEPSQIKSAELVTYDDAGNVIPLSERFNPENEDIRFSASGPITYDNFHKETAGVWEIINPSEVPSREADYTSTRFMRPDLVCSRYWYGSDEKGDYVIRESDHWSASLHGENGINDFMANPSSRKYTPISSARWAIDMRNATEEGTYNKVKPEFFKDGKAYGKIYLSDLRRMEGQVMFSVRNTPISPEVRAEMDAIAATAMVNGNYMLAPNGQPTKLTADQWAMVRTKAFKACFGDWEKAARIQL